MLRINSLVRLLWLALVLLIGGSARAAAPHPSCDDDPACQQLAAEGLDQFSAGHFAEAQQSFARAYKLRADPTLLYNLGRALHKAGRPQEAAPYYQRFLDVGSAGDEVQRRKAEQYLSQAQKEAAPPPVTLPLKPAAGPPEAAPLQRVPVYRKPWLWAVVGVAVAGAAVGLGVGLASRRPDLTDTMPAHPFAN